MTDNMLLTEEREETKDHITTLPPAFYQTWNYSSTFCKLKLHVFFKK